MKVRDREDGDFQNLKKILATLISSQRVGKQWSEKLMAEKEVSYISIRGPLQLPGNPGLFERFLQLLAPLVQHPWIQLDERRQRCISGQQAALVEEGV